MTPQAKRDARPSRTQKRTNKYRKRSHSRQRNDESNRSTPRGSSSSSNKQQANRSTKTKSRRPRPMTRKPRPEPSRPRRPLRSKDDNKVSPRITPSPVSRNRLGARGVPARQAGTLRMWPLGGNEEVGRNSTVFELDGDIIILDAGHMFPEEDMPGVDYIIPNLESLKGREKDIRAVVLSHGHLDHIGALPHLLPKLGNPTVVGSDMTLALVKKRNDEFKANPPLNTITIKKDGETLRLGKFKITFFSVAHSIRDSFGVVIQAPYINLVHMGDWRYDLEPVEGRPTDFTRLSKWNTRKVPSVLAFESLGSTREGHQTSEKKVYDTTKQLIKNAPGRIILATFSSMLDRVGQVIDISEKLGRKVVIDGYSMKAAVEIGKKFGYIHARQSTFIDIKQVNKYPPHKVTIVATGSQADERSALVRIANHEHRQIRIEPKDTIIFSSSVIPGNERSIQRLMDNLYRQGANVIHKEIQDSIHGGGHAYRDDIRLLLRQVKPKYVMPVFANHYMLKEAEKLVIGEGWKKEDVFVLDNGEVLELGPKGLKRTGEKMNTDYVFVDGLGVGDVSNIVIKDRQMLADDGMIVVIATLRKRNGRLVHNPDIISRGFVHMKENKELVENVRRKARKVVMDHYDPRTPAQDMYIKNKLRTELGQFVMQKTERRPMILPVVIEV